MPLLKHLLLVTVMALPLVATAENATQPGLKTPLSAQNTLRGAQIKVDETSKLKLEIGRLRQQMAAMRQQMQQMSQELKRFKRQYAVHRHGVEGNAAPISQFSGSAARLYPGASVSLSKRGLLQTGRPIE